MTRSAGSRSTQEASNPIHRYLPWAFCLLAILIRLPNLGWGLPEIEEEALPLRKALEMGGWQAGTSLAMNPRTAGWPSLSFYVHLALQSAFYLVGRIFGRFGGPAEFHAAVTRDMTLLVIVSRAVGVAAMAAVVWLGCRLSLQLAGVMGAILVGLALAASPLLVSQSQLITPDVLLTLFSALALAAILSVHDRGRMKDYLLAGLWIGLGMSSKYTPVLFLTGLVAAHALRGRSERRGPAVFADRRLWLAVAVAGATFIATSPFLLVDLAVLRRDFAHQVLHMSKGHFGQESHPLGHWFYVSRVLVPGLGLPALLIAVAGLAWAAWRRRGAWMVVAWTVVPFFLVMGSLATHFERYMLPLLMPLSLGLAAAWEGITPVLRGRSPALLRAGFPVVCAAILIPEAGATWTYHRLMSRDSTYRQATEYVLRNLAPRPVFLALESYSVNLPERPDPSTAPDRSGAGAVRYHPRFGWITIPLYSIGTEHSSIYYDLRHFLLCDYIVTSAQVRGRFEANPDAYAVQCTFYRDLDTYATLEASISEAQNLRGPEIRIYRFDGKHKNRLLADRGPLDPGFVRGHEPVFNTPQYLNFFSTLARRAYDSDALRALDLYAGLLAATTTGEPRLESLLNAAVARRRLNRPDEAEPLLREYLQARPNDIFGLANLGVLLQMKGDMKGAEAAYRKAIELDVSGQVSWVKPRLEEVRASMVGGAPD